jgi:hypothetical protein
MTAASKPISGTAILHLLGLIGDCDNNITLLRQSGELETGLLIRQEKHLKYQFCKELNGLLAKDKLKIKVVEV